MTRHSRMLARLPRKMVGLSVLSAATTIATLTHFNGLALVQGELAFASVPIFSHRTAASISSSSTLKMQRRVFCYGDSLTAGSSPPLIEEHPYGPHLEEALKTLLGFDSAPGTDAPSIAVRWLGLPGWTATALAENLDSSNGLRYLLRRVKDATGSPVNLAVIMAGTNDLAYATNSEPVVAALKTLHRAAHEEGVPTLAVGIPPSGWQSMDAGARGLAADINSALKQWCEGSDVPARFVDCPIQAFAHFNLWAPDGLHFSPQGFQALGEGLANDVLDSLKSVDQSNAA